MQKFSKLFNILNVNSQSYRIGYFFALLLSFDKIFRRDSGPNLKRMQKSHEVREDTNLGGGAAMLKSALART
jgi:hypothetical protein